MTLYSLHCPCGERIVLPPQSPLGRFDDQASEPNSQRWPLKFLCRECGLLSVHRVQEIDREEHGRPDLFESDRTLWSVQILCDHRGCGNRYSICTQSPRYDGRDEALYIFQHAKRPVTCGVDGHSFDPAMVLYCGLLTLQT